MQLYILIYTDICCLKFLLFHPLCKQLKMLFNFRLSQGLWLGLMLPSLYFSLYLEYIHSYTMNALEKSISYFFVKTIRNHSKTTWTIYWSFLTTYPTLIEKLNVDKNSPKVDPCSQPLGQLPKNPVNNQKTEQLPLTILTVPALPTLFVHVVFECLLNSYGPLIAAFLK